MKDQTKLAAMHIRYIIQWNLKSRTPYKLLADFDLLIGLFMSFPSKCINCFLQRIGHFLAVETFVNE